MEDKPIVKLCKVNIEVGTLYIIRNSQLGAYSPVVGPGWNLRVVGGMATVLSHR